MPSLSRLLDALRPRDMLVAILHALAILLALGTVFLHRDAVVDDAYIGLRYAQNLLEGHGLVFNPGERIEGITNTGFIVLVAGLGALGMDLLDAARLLGLSGAITAAVLVPIVIAPGPMQARTRAIARVLLGSGFFFVFFAWTGMETGFAAGLVAVQLALVSRGQVGAAAGVLAGLAFSVRPETPLPVVMALLLAGRPWRQPGAWTMVLVVAILECCRFSMFGAWWPNTAVVKGMLGTTETGVAWYGASGDDLVEALAQTGGPFALALAVLGLRHASGPQRLGGWICLGYVAFELYAMGDWMLGFRYLQPALPIYATLIAIGAVATLRSLRITALGILLLVAGYQWSFGLRFRQDAGQYPHFVMTSRDGTTAARWLAEHYARGTTVVCWRIGALGYHSGLHVIDTNGLVDAEIARALPDTAAVDRVVQSRAPTLVLARGKPDVPASAEQVLYGATFVHRRTFAQGRDQTWELYERAEP